MIPGGAAGGATEEVPATKLLPQLLKLAVQPWLAPLKFSCQMVTCACARWEQNRRAVKTVMGKVRKDMRVDEGTVYENCIKMVVNGWIGITGR